MRIAAKKNLSKSIDNVNLEAEKKNMSVVNIIDTIYRKSHDLKKEKTNVHNHSFTSEVMMKSISRQAVFQWQCIVKLRECIHPDRSRWLD